MNTVVVSNEAGLKLSRNYNGPPKEENGTGWAKRLAGIKARAAVGTILCLIDEKAACDGGLFAAGHRDKMLEIGNFLGVISKKNG